MKAFTVAIPTYNRPKDLGDCLGSILAQLPPDEVLVVDDGALPVPFVEEWKRRFAERRVVLNYYKKNHAVEPRGTSESKNVALRVAKGEILFFFDDDVVLGPDFLKAIMAVWNADPDEKLMGVGGVIENMRGKFFLEEEVFNRFFGLTSPVSWDVNDAGFQVWDPSIRETTKGYFIFGGVSSYRREAMAKLGFAPLSGGRTELEDVDFCWHAKRAGYHMLVVPTARLVHNESPVSREAKFLVGVKQSASRREMFQRYGVKSLRGRLWFVWANVGWILRQALVLNWRGAAGRVYGLFLNPPPTK